MKCTAMVLLLLCAAVSARRLVRRGTPISGPGALKGLKGPPTGGPRRVQQPGQSTGGTKSTPAVPENWKPLMGAEWEIPVSSLAVAIPKTDSVAGATMADMSISTHKLIIDRKKDESFEYDMEVALSKSIVYTDQYKRKQTSNMKYIEWAVDHDGNNPMLEIVTGALPVDTFSSKAHAAMKATANAFRFFSKPATEARRPRDSCCVCGVTVRQEVVALYRGGEPSGEDKEDCEKKVVAVAGPGKNVKNINCRVRTECSGMKKSADFKAKDSPKASSQPATSTIAPEPVAERGGKYYYRLSDVIDRYNSELEKLGADMEVFKVQEEELFLDPHKSGQRVGQTSKADRKDIPSGSLQAFAVIAIDDDDGKMLTNEAGMQLNVNVALESLPFSSWLSGTTKDHKIIQVGYDAMVKSVEEAFKNEAWEGTEKNMYLGFWAGALFLHASNVVKELHFPPDQASAIKNIPHMLIKSTPNKWIYQMGKLGASKESKLVKKKLKEFFKKTPQEQIETEKIFIKGLIELIGALSTANAKKPATTEELKAKAKSINWDAGFADAESLQKVFQATFATALDPAADAGDEKYRISMSTGHQLSAVQFKTSSKGDWIPAVVVEDRMGGVNTAAFTSEDVRDPAVYKEAFQALNPELDLSGMQFA